ncbi:MAG TPA: NADH-quinone oxidoreductase subunit NuoF [Firmicutes bacterium]|nr:NADH-quinone oxidoreductase subunit NuoF [Bacillota bacterium]
MDNERGIRHLDAYRSTARYVPEGEPGGYRAAEHVLKNLKPGEVIEQAKAAGLRGKGGAGFPAGLKWSFVPQDSPKPKYLAINGDEGEPGTFKDRFIMEDCPHRLIEGAIIACYAFGGHMAYCYIRGEFYDSIRLLNKAVEEAYAAGVLGDKPFGVDYPMHFQVHTGAGAYICGEETSMLSSLMGERGHPRMKPPFPAVEGLWRSPTIINNVETIATVPAIFDAGVDWFTARGTEKSPGIKVVSVSGCVRNPGWWEIEYGTPMNVLIDELAGGMKPGRRLKAIVPGGSSCPLLRADKAATPYDYESLMEAGSMLGSAALIALDDTVNIVEVMKNFSHFYAHESCGKCTPCREGTRWMLQIHQRILSGGGNKDDLKLLKDIVAGIEAKSFCPLGDAAAWPVKSAVERFPEEYEEFIEKSQLRIAVEAEPAAEVEQANV